MSRPVDPAEQAEHSRPPGDAPDSGSFSSVMARNIRALRDKRREQERRAGLQEKLADAITRFTGSMLFVYIHLVIVGLWIAVNLGWLPLVPVFDPTFVILASAASVEAIFLSTFVLISQNRAAAAADRRAELDLQVGLLTEHELTRLLALVVEMAERMGIQVADDPGIREMEEDVAPENVYEELSREQEPAS